MPVYATKAELLEAHGLSEATVASDSEATGAINDTEVTRWLKGAAAEIESYASPYELVPDDVAAEDPATEGTYPRWWKYANVEMALYRMSLDVGAATKEKRQRYEDWIRRLESVYPSTDSDGNPTGPSGTVGVRLVAQERIFTRDKMGGLL